MNSICVVKLDDGRWQLMFGPKPIYKPMDGDEARKRLEDMAELLRYAFVIGYEVGFKSRPN